MKKIYSILFALLALVGVAQAQTIVFTAGTDKTDSDDARTLTKDGVTLTITDGRLNTAEYRFYKGKALTISSTVGDIAKIEFTCTASGDAKYGPGCFSAQDGYSFEEKVGTWTGSATSVSFNPESNQVRASKIEVTIKNSDPDFVAAPRITPATGTYYAAQEVTITAEEGATIYYTTDGGDPKASDAVYAAPFTVDKTTTVKAVAAKGDNMSEVVESVITIETLSTQTIADVLAAGAGTGSVSATVVATASTGVLLQDATGLIFAYTGDTPEVTIGDVVAVAGPTVEYGGRLQFNEKATITKTGTTTVSYPEPTVLDGAAFDALVANLEVKYVKVEGTITSVGTYYNFKIDGASNTGSIVAPADVLSQLVVNAKVTLTGYFVYVTGSKTKYGNIIVTKVDQPDVEYTEYNSLDAVKAAASDEESYAQLNVNDLLVSYVNGQSVYLFDGTDGMLVFGANSKNLKTGDKISGTIKGKLYKRYGNTQIANPVYDVTVSSSDNVVTPQEVSPAVFNATGALFENELITLTGLVPDAEALENKVITFKYEDEEEEDMYTFTVRDNFGVATTMTFDKEKAYTVTGFVAIYTRDDVTTIQIYPRSTADLDNGEEPQPYEFVGDGTFEKPYTVEDIQHKEATDTKTALETDIWVKAYIVGYINGSALNAETATFNAEGETVKNSNVLLADAADAASFVKVIPVALPAGGARADLNLADHPTMLGTLVWLKGGIYKYMGFPGLKDVKVYSLDGINIVDAINDIETEAAPAEQTIYTISGQRVQNLSKRGLYIVNGKKVVVK